jgi:hypothetical protein
VLQFELDNSPKTRDTIRISIMDLIRVTSHISTENVFVQVKIQSNEGAKEDNSLDIPLENIRQQALRCLSDILATCSEYYARPCPELWINGFSNIVEMTQGSDNTPVSLEASTPTRASAFMQKHKLCEDDPVPRWQRLDIVIPLFPIRRVSDFQFYDGTLQNHIAYLRSVIRHADQTDQYARACKCDLLPYPRRGELTTAEFGHGPRLVREPSWRETGYEWEDMFKPRLQGDYKQCHFEDGLEDHVDD